MLPPLRLPGHRREGGRLRRGGALLPPQAPQDGRRLRRGVSATLAHGTADGLKVLRQFPFSQSLGWFYETVAEHLGLGNWTSSGKLMGLAGFGNPDRYTLDFLTARAGGSSRRG
ncbi:carbamoyltransferase N-terminal domain-containing protein [Streptomyces sp. NPDC017520]|uniref:carbamoyltransferase N-terminal domain-containing protein n=1 Tax=Streptomyces sp. NPDC017520 TaxID=3364998 RepID=UPI003793F17F